MRANERFPAKELQAKSMKVSRRGGGVEGKMSAYPPHVCVRLPDAGGRWRE